MVNGSSRPYLKGAISGVFAALVLIASSLIVRAEFGIGTIAELASDRIAPLTGIPLFFKLLNLLSGYSHLKQLGIVATLLLELAGGAIVGLLYTRLQRSERRPRAMAVTSAVVAGILLLTLVGLWPNLLTNYDGLPPLTARPLPSSACSSRPLCSSQLSSGPDLSCAGASSRRWSATNAVEP